MTRGPARHSVIIIIIIDFIKETHFLQPTLMFVIYFLLYHSSVALILPHIFIFFFVIDYLYSLSLL